MSFEKCHVYIMSNKNRTVLYIGVTSTLAKGVAQHKMGEGSLFTRRYRCTDLVYHEEFPDIVSAIRREKQLKEWNRIWKEDLIRSINPDMEDLYDKLMGF